MSKGFKWTISIILLFVVGVIARAFYDIRQDEKAKAQNVEKASLNTADHSQEIDKHQLEMAAQTMIDNENAQNELKKNPPRYESLSLEQTKQFIERVENLRKEDTKVNLAYLPDVAKQSRKYNALVEEAQAIYGTEDISNPYRYCTSMTSFARELWSAQYSQSTVSDEYREKTKTLFLKSYADAKKACLEDVQK